MTHIYICSRYLHSSIELYIYGRNSAARETNAASAWVSYGNPHKMEIAWKWVWKRRNPHSNGQLLREYPVTRTYDESKTSKSKSLKSSTTFTCRFVLQRLKSHEWLFIYIVEGQGRFSGHVARAKQNGSENSLPWTSKTRTAHKCKQKNKNM